MKFQMKSRAHTGMQPTPAIPVRQKSHRTAPLGPNGRHGIPRGSKPLTNMSNTDFPPCSDGSDDRLTRGESSSARRTRDQTTTMPMTMKTTINRRQSP